MKVTKLELAIWLVLIGVCLVLAVPSGLLFARDVFLPDHYTGDMRGYVVVFGVSMLAAIGAAVFVGATLMFVGAWKRLLLFRFGACVVCAALTALISLGMMTLSEQRHRGRSAECMKLGDAELERLAAGRYDPAVKSEMAARALQKRAAIYHGAGNDDLLALWVGKKDLWAFEELQKRFLLYDAQKDRYSKLSGDELARLVVDEKEPSAWFEVRRRKGKAGAIPGLELGTR